MSNLTHTEAFKRFQPDWVVINKADKKALIERFLEIVEQSQKPIVALIQSRLIRLQQRKLITLNEMMGERIALGLNELIRTPDKTSNEDFSILALFFIKYFLAQLDLFGTADQERYINRFAGTLKDAHGLPGMMFELAVANTFRHKGNHVDFLLEESKHDLHIKSAGCEMEVECKCVNSSAKAQVASQAIDTVHVFTEYVDENFAGKQLLFQFQYKGNGETAKGALVEDAKALIEVMQGRAEAATKYWSATVSPMPEKLKGKLFDDFLAEPELAPHLGSITLAGQNCIVAVNSDRGWRLVDRTDAVISKAIDQLARTGGKRAVFLQITGSEPLIVQTKNEHALAQIILGWKPTKQRIIKEISKQDGFIGISLSGQFTTTDFGDHWFIDYPSHWLADNVELSYFESEFWKRLPSDAVRDSKP